jgi:hypothetical protein
LQVERQKVIRFEYDGMVFEEGLRLDLLVEGRVVRRDFTASSTTSNPPRLRASA